MVDLSKAEGEIKLLPTTSMGAQGGYIQKIQSKGLTPARGGPASSETMGQSLELRTGAGLNLSSNRRR